MLREIINMENSLMPFFIFIKFLNFENIYQKAKCSKFSRKYKIIKIQEINKSANLLNSDKVSLTYFNKLQF